MPGKTGWDSIDNVLSGRGFNEAPAKCRGKLVSQRDAYRLAVRLQ